MNRNLQRALVFFSVFCYQISQVFIANYLFVINFIIQLFKYGTLRFNSRFASKVLLFCFIVYISINTIVYSISNNSFDLRNFIQLIYNFQYLFLIIYIKLDYPFIIKTVFKAAIVLSHILVLHFFISGDSIDLYNWNEFANDFFPGWSNTLPLYLIFALFINRKFQFSLYFNIILFFSIILTGSRGALLGAIGVLLLPVFRKYKRYTNTLLLTGLIVIIFFFGTLTSLESEFQFLRVFDRIDIFYTSMSFIEQSWFFGYGGNTIDQLTHIITDYEPLMDWGHTHNFLLEFTLRYGLVGAVLFILFVFFKIREIKDYDFRYLFFLFMILAFFQTFMRDFIFLSILILISHYRYFKSSNISSYSIKKCN